VSKGFADVTRKNGAGVVRGICITTMGIAILTVAGDTAIEIRVALDEANEKARIQAASLTPGGDSKVLAQEYIHMSNINYNKPVQTNSVDSSNFEKNIPWQMVTD
jgi:hypothetical protein